MPEMQEKYMELVGALIGLARTAVNYELTDELTDTVLTALCAKDLGEEEQTAMILKIHEQKFLYAPDCRYCANPCDRTADADMHEISAGMKKIYDLKMKVLGTISSKAMAMKAGKLPISMMMLMEGLTYIGEDMPESDLEAFMERNN